jgi:hypothetical protein
MPAIVLNEFGGGGGVTPLREAIYLKNAMVIDGCPVIGDEDSWATVAAAIVFYLAGHRLRVTGDWNSSLHPTDETLALMIDPLMVAALGRTPTWDTVLNWCAAAGRVRILYDGDGVPHIRESKTALDSGLAIVCDPDYPSRVQLPWEHPIERKIAQPEFALFEYWIATTTMVGEPLVLNTYNMPVFGQQAGLPEMNGVPFAAVFGGPVTTLEQLASVVSNAAVNPYVSGMSRSSVEISNGAYSFNAQDQTAAIYAQERLHTVLAAADVVTVPVDSSFPASNYIMQDIYINLPEEGISGWFTLNEIQQPLDENPSTLVLNWNMD